MIKLMLISNDPAQAREAVACGVNRLFVDLEVHGKHERQGHRDTLISDHDIKDVREVRQACPDTELLVRLNPLYDGTLQEVEQALTAGADLLMLPMFESPQQLATFVEMVAGRAKVVPLVETPAALESIDELVAMPGVDELYIGLNDLHMALGMAFMFEPLVNGMVERAARVAREQGVAFGFGGIARMGEGLLSGEMVLGEHLRLGSSAVILSRTFLRSQDIPQGERESVNFCDEIRRLREAEQRLLGRDARQKAADRQQVAEKVEQIRDAILQRRGA